MRKSNVPSSVSEAATRPPSTTSDALLARLKTQPLGTHAPVRHAFDKSSYKLHHATSSSSSEGRQSHSSLPQLPSVESAAHAHAHAHTEASAVSAAQERTSSVGNDKGGLKPRPPASARASTSACYVGNFGRFKHEKEECLVCFR